MAHVSRWLAAHDFEPAALRGVEIERFVQERRASYAHLASARALQPLLGYLRGLGVVPPAASREAPTPADELSDELEDVVADHVGDRKIEHPSEGWTSGHSLGGLDDESTEAVRALGDE